MNALKKVAKIAALYMLFAIAISITNPLLYNAIYSYYTHNWTPLVSAAGSFVIGFTLGSASLAASKGIALGMAAASIAAKLTPWGWVAIGVVFVGL